MTTADLLDEPQHVCQPPSGEPAGTIWVCPDCESEFLRRPCRPKELGGRVVPLWVREYEPIGGAP